MKALLIQARSSSRRFPGKMLTPITDETPLIEYVYRRSSASKESDIVAVITSDDNSDDGLFAYCIKHNIKVFRGPLDNVLDRYIKAAEFFKASVICRVCGDSPFVDIELIDKMFNILAEEGLDYIAPDKGTCIAGLDSEVVTLSALRRIAEGASAEESEHVTLFLKNNKKKFKTKFLDAEMRPPGISDISLVVDYPKDMELCNKIAGYLGFRYDFRTRDIFDFLLKERKNADSRFP